MDNAKFLSIASQLNSISDSYVSGDLKHYEYVKQYDKVLELAGISKKQLIQGLKERGLI